MAWMGCIRSQRGSQRNEQVEPAAVVVPEDVALLKENRDLLKSKV